MDKKIKKATTKKRTFALKINIKKSQGQSEHTSYRVYNARVKGRAKTCRQ